jgi:peptidyl-prolyl cis-trans isomerase B (cyclophilin B)
MRFSIILGLIAFALVATANADEKTPSNPRVALETSMGKVVLELFADKAPVTVANFLAYVKSGFYDGTVFHRVIPDFMIQGGGFTAGMKKKPANPPIVNEADSGLRNERGTIAMARTSDPHSATCQFFINTKDNAFLNHRGKNSKGWGYAAFGKVLEGMEVVDAVSKVPTGTRGPFRDVPVEPVVIQKAGIIGE